MIRVVQVDPESLVIRACRSGLLPVYIIRGPFLRPCEAYWRAIATFMSVSVSGMRSPERSIVTRLSVPVKGKSSV
jgi:hypothetical protein